ncbi:MAG: hypothetical protein E6G94_04940 [Alphaproteobacteria bacterium]|nr:MAG: hypothetical protein E6G94_04940 [Alphaproteobacteria bacterium]
MYTNRGAWLGTLALLGGCTTSLDVQPLAPSGSRAGIAYVLPFTQYTITETWRLANCTAGEQKVGLKVEASAGQADDGLHQYLIDAASLQRLMTKSDFKATFYEDSNVLKTINASVEDRSGAVIGNIVKTVATLAPLAMGVPSTAALAEPVSACNKDIQAALETAAGLKAELDQSNADVAAATDKVVALAARIARMGTSVDEATSKQYGAALAQLDDLVAAQGDLAGRLAEALKPISYQRIVRWPSRSDCFESRAGDEIPAAVLEKWFQPGQAPSDRPKAYFGIERAGSFGVEPTGCPAGSPAAGPMASNAAGQVSGIRYRMPAKGRLVTCREPSCTSEDPAKGIVLVEGAVAQLGYINTLPVETRAFGSNSFSAEFRPAGGLASAGYAQTAAPLEGATAAIADAAGGLAPLLDPSARLASETAYLKALKERRDAAVALQPTAASPNADALAGLDADTTLLNAQIAKLQAEHTLRQLQAQPSD